MVGWLMGLAKNTSLLPTRIVDNLSEGKSELWQKHNHGSWWLFKVLSIHFNSLAIGLREEFDKRTSLSTTAGQTTTYHLFEITLVKGVVNGPVFQISEMSQVKNLTKSATWPDKFNRTFTIIWWEQWELAHWQNSFWYPTYLDTLFT